MNPRKISAFEKGHLIKSKKEDEQWWLRFREYGIVATMIGVRNGVWGKDKVEYPKKPYLREEDKEAKEKELQMGREAFLGGLLAMQANFELTHQKKDGE